MAVASYCTNCKHLSVCKFTQAITAFDLTVAKFTNDNVEGKITAVSVTYDCKNKLKIV